MTEEKADGASRWRIQHTATSNSGNSGGPLLLEDGTEVGINTWFAEGAAANVLYSLSLAQLRIEIERHVKEPVWR